MGVFLLRWEGRILAAFSHRRLREKPPAGGVSVYCESIPLDPALEGQARALLEFFDWRGVAMVEYRRDAGTGTHYLMEINGRFWGSLQLAIDAGVNFPLLLAGAALGDPVQQPAYQVGVRYRWWWGDVDQLLIRLRRPQSRLNAKPESRFRALTEFLALGSRRRGNGVPPWDDLGPFARETLNWLAATLLS